jgi:hypothetical protein
MKQPSKAAIDAARQISTVVLIAPVEIVQYSDYILALIAAVEADALERAARAIECNCDNKDDVVTHPISSAARWHLCGEANCCAIQAADIRAMKP